MFGMLFLGLFGCTDPNGQQTPVDDNTDVNNGDTTIPSFKILSPLQGEVVEIEGKTGDVTVMLSTNDLKLIAGTENING